MAIVFQYVRELRVLLCRLEFTSTVSLIFLSLLHGDLHKITVSYH